MSRQVCRCSRRHQKLFRWLFSTSLISSISFFSIFIYILYVLMLYTFSWAPLVIHIIFHLVWQGIPLLYISIAMAFLSAQSSRPTPHISLSIYIAIWAIIASLPFYHAAHPQRSDPFSLVMPFRFLQLFSFASLSFIIPLLAFTSFSTYIILRHIRFEFF